MKESIKILKNTPIPNQIFLFIYAGKKIYIKLRSFDVNRNRMLFSQILNSLERIYFKNE